MSVVAFAPRITFEGHTFALDIRTRIAAELPPLRGTMTFDELELAFGLAALTIFHDGGADTQPARASQLLAAAEAFDRINGDDPAPRHDQLSIAMDIGLDNLEPEIPTIPLDSPAL